jgi:hypothetical protein
MARRAPVLEPAVSEKPCPGTICQGKTQPASAFNKNPRDSTGLNRCCRACRKHDRDERERKLRERRGNIEAQILRCGNPERMATLLCHALDVRGDAVKQVFSVFGLLQEAHHE